MKGERAPFAIRDGVDLDVGPSGADADRPGALPLYRLPPNPVQLASLAPW